MADGLFGTGVAVPSIRQPALTPTGIPGSTYVRPQQKQTGGNLSALADSLSGLNNALQSFGAASARSDRDPDSEANRQFADSIAGMSLEDAMKKYPEAKNRIQKDGVLSLVGSKAAYEFRQFVTEQYNNGGFDQNSGDFNSWVEGHRREYAARLQDPAMQAAFFRGTDNWTQQFGEADLKRKLENTISERDTAVVDEFRMIADDGISGGKSGEEIADLIIKQSSANRTFRGLDGKSQNETLFRLAEEYALKGQPELVKALLNNKRGGIGPLLEVSGYTDRGLTLIQRAETEQQQAANSKSFTTRTKLDEDAMYGRLTEEQIKGVQRTKGNEWLTDARAAEYLESSKRNKAQLLAGQAREEEKRRLAFQSTGQRTQAFANAFAELETLGGAQRLKDVEYMGPDGNMRTLTAKEQQDEVVKRKLSLFEDAYSGLIARGVSKEDADEQVLKAKLAWFDGNGLMNPEWDGRLNSTNVVASVARILQKGETSDYLAASAETYRQIRSANPAYADKLVRDQRSHEFFEAYADAVADGADKNEALILGARIANRSPFEKSWSTLSPSEALEASKKVLKEAGGGGFLGFGGVSLDDDMMLSPENIDFVQERLVRYTARGMTIDRATDRVAEELRTKAFVINGALVPDRRGLPKDFPDLMLSALQDAFEVFGKQYNLPSVDDLYVSEISDSGRWVILSKSNGGMPIGGGASVSLNDLAIVRSRTERKKQEIYEGMRAKEQAKREKALSDYRIMDASRARRIESLKRSGGLSAMFARMLEARRDQEYVERSAHEREMLYRAETEKRVQEIQSGRRKGPLEEEGIIIPSLGPKPGDGVPRVHLPYPATGVAE
ncbi:hypothetical protein [Mesorhizobium sp.]|uniref:hypothetical protein n=1 Tax=Mesorhizobium sp. TaxID=1871066 RepID=UPI0011FFFE3F|nr:hypothetical protein [Mesorhizobium sp.]TIP72181.1 MAG: hypothetical protein E5X55_19420 [Mesorhizobium sp.]TJV96448.1 MAG: hypothetical protein E5X52_18665 [Mesorhizobium sp.]